MPEGGSKENFNGYASDFPTAVLRSQVWMCGTDDVDFCDDRGAFRTQSNIDNGGIFKKRGI